MEVGQVQYSRERERERVSGAGMTMGWWQTRRRASYTRGLHPCCCDERQAPVRAGLNQCLLINVHYFFFFYYYYYLLHCCTIFQSGWVSPRAWFCNICSIAELINSMTISNRHNLCRIIWFCLGSSDFYEVITLICIRVKYFGLFGRWIHKKCSFFV